MNGATVPGPESQDLLKGVTGYVLYATGPGRLDCGGIAAGIDGRRSSSPFGSLTMTAAAARHAEIQ